MDTPPAPQPPADPVPPSDPAPPPGPGPGSAPAPSPDSDPRSDPAYPPGSATPDPDSRSAPASRRGKGRRAGSADSAGPSQTDLRARLADLTLTDRRRLSRRLDAARGARDRGAALARLGEDVASAERRVAARRANVPVLRYPPGLPVSEHVDDIAAAIAEHQVVIVAGETGSGKTTQLPKICLGLGRGVHGMIGHTQPRRIAARTVADRIAEELDVPVGGAVGYQVRFTDRVGDTTLVKLMTDGILLAEIQRDRMLRRYDTIIIDEAHERSLNIDFLLGYLKRLLPRRPDLKLIITSATIETSRFSRHFDDAPVVEVSGRTYPVEVRYRPVIADESDRDRDQVQAIGDAVDELVAEGPGDILVFLSGEREIRDTADALRRRRFGRDEVEVLPLYSRLSAAEQHRVFQRHTGRRVVLATNVAETSLTVPGIRYVVDPGTARISRYSHRLKVQRLPIEAVSQASANQRAGRCGRTADGICVRLYEEEDFAGRPEFTEPEILRTNLASVILQMASAGLGEVESFPFLDPPDRRQIRDGMQLLTELGALTGDGGLTPLGRRLAQLPVDPRLARMVLEADRQDCVREVLVIAAALSIQDPRERPTEAQAQATQAHARFTDKTSDFLAYLNLWRYLGEAQRELSSNQFRKLCRAEYLNYLRVREWQDLHSQLRQVASGMGITRGSADAPGERVHTALLAGLLSHIGRKDTEKKNQKARGPVEYLGARGARFAVFPGSALAKRQPDFVMAAELVETSRLWARVVAAVEPSTVESLAAHLVKRTYSEPHWEKKQAAVVAYEKVTLYGVPVVARRKVNYGRIDPEVSRELFIRHALVEGDWETHHEFLAANRDLLDEVEGLESRVRRRDILVDDETLFAFYDARIPADVVSGRHFDSWWKKARRDRPDLLTFPLELLVNEDARAVATDDYPDVWERDGLRLALSYEFEPGSPADGVTAHIPLAVLGQVGPEQFGWQVPGLRAELLTALLRSLPKPLRRNFVPVPDFVRAVLARVSPADGPLLSVLERALRELSGVTVPRDAWQPAAVPDHLRMRFAVEDEYGHVLAEGKDLTVLKEKLAEQARTALAAAGDTLERSGLRDWDLDELPTSYQQTLAGQTVTSYPALVDEGPAGVAVRLLESPTAQRQAMWLGTRRLILDTLPSPAKYVLANLSNTAKLALSSNPHGSVAALLADCTACAADKLIADAGGPAYDAAGFNRLRDAVRATLNPTVLGALTAVERILARTHAVRARISGTGNVLLLPALSDIRAQLDALVGPGFVTATGWDHLGDLPRYLTAVERRLDRLPANPDRDRDLMRRVHALEQEYADVAADHPDAPGLPRVRWMLEELRVSYFAQALGTPYPVSDRRIERALDDITG